jgi:hypothetical protein
MSAADKIPPVPLWVPNYFFGDAEYCTYYGEHPDEIEHVVPVAFWCANPSYRGAYRNKGLRTWACRRCNQILSDKVFWKFSERVSFVRQAYQRIAQKTKKTCAWSDAEIAGLRDSLRTYVANAQMKLRETDRKLTWLDSIGFRVILSDAKLSSFADESSPKYSSWFDSFINS